MILLTDIDVFQKLAICDLLDEALDVLKTQKTDLRVLATLKYRLKNDEKQAKIDPVVLNRMKTFLVGIREVEEFSKDVVTRLDDSVGIDQGETILLAAAIEDLESLILTGDKNFVRSLSNIADLVDLAKKIQGRIVCFEQILRRCIQSYAFDHVRSKVVANRGITFDTVLRVAFGSGASSTESESLACLHSYVQELRKQPIDLLQPDLVEEAPKLTLNI